MPRLYPHIVSPEGSPPMVARGISKSPSNQNSNCAITLNVSAFGRPNSSALYYALSGARNIVLTVRGDI